MSNGIKLNWKKPVSQIIREDANINADTLLFAARQWWELYYPWVPMGESGQLADDVEFTATEGKGTIRHKAPYAVIQYAGAERVSQRGRHPLASSFWDRAAMAAGKGEELARRVAAYVKGRG